MAGAGTWDGVGCEASATSTCLQAFTAKAHAAAARKHSSLTWCEYCAADGVHGRSMLSATLDWRVMDCRGLTEAERRSCKSARRAQ